MDPNTTASMATGHKGRAGRRVHMTTPTAAPTTYPPMIAARLNALIAAGHPVAPRWITDEELAARPELVRTMSVKPPSGAGRVRLMEVAGPDGQIDLQPCGGTHIRNTAEIGPVTIAKIENKGRQNRRVIVAFAE